MLIAFCAMQAFNVVADNLPQLGKSPIKDIVKAMTLEEKLEFIHGTGMLVSNTNGPVAGNIGGVVPGAAGTTFAIPRLGIPAIVMADGPAGLRIDSMRVGDTKRYYATAFPTGTIAASTWNPLLIRQMGEAMGEEVRDYGVDILLAPAVNIQRNPLCGRNFEYYSEDPLLSGMMGAAFIQGVQRNGVGVSLKHYAANNQETSRASVDAIVSQRALREIYLHGFEIAVKARPWTVMSAYNKINGVFCSENPWLLTDVLRNEWGFKGMVMTDWFSGRNYANQLKAGNDLLMPGRKAETKRIKAALENGQITEADIDKNVERILELILKCPTFKHYPFTNQPNLKGHAVVAREVAEEGMVLLKNKSQTLPLAKTQLTVLGNASYSTYVGGTGSGEVSKAYEVSIAQGLKDAGFQIATTLFSTYATHIAEEKAKQPKRTNILQKINNLPEKTWTENELKQMASSSEAALITIGRNAGEGADRKVETDYLLSDAEQSLIFNTAKAFHAQSKKVIVVLNIDGVVDVTSWRDKADAILLAWLPGQEAGHALASIVTGKKSPSGKLAQTFPVRYSDVPSATAFPGVPISYPDSTIYNEGIYVGYRYYTSKGVPTAYPFGYGLSYTTFAMKQLKLSSNAFKDKLTATVTVTNTGKRPGKEVVQLYLSAPAAKIDKPRMELKGFIKTRLLRPGEAQTLSFTLFPEDLASFSEQNQAWVADKGSYTVNIGNSSEHIMQRASFVLNRQINIKP
jgi:glycoside hydrolase, family 3 domain protein